MKTTKTTHVEYALHVGFFAEYTSHAVKTRNVNAALKALPDHAYGFRFYDVVTKETEDAGEVFRKSQRANESGWYYVGTALTLDDVRRTMPKSILLSNMECNEIHTVCTTLRGNTVVVEDNDVVLAPLMSQR